MPLKYYQEHLFRLTGIDNIEIPYTKKALLILLVSLWLFIENLNIFDKMSLIVETDLMIFKYAEITTYMFQIEKIFQLKQHIKGSVCP